MTENPTLKTLELTFSNGDTIRVEASLVKESRTYDVGSLSVGVSGNVSGGGTTEHKTEYSDEQALRTWIGGAMNQKYLNHGGKTYLTAQIVSVQVVSSGFFIDSV